MSWSTSSTTCPYALILASESISTSAPRVVSSVPVCNRRRDEREASGTVDPPVNVQALVGVIVGLVMFGGGCLDLRDQLHGRRRLIRVPGVVVGHVEVRRTSQTARSRAARLRFTTADGQVVETVSDLSTFPGKKLGRQITVAYDPQNPQRTADLAGVKVLELVLDPLLIVGGAVLAGFAVTQL